MRCGECNLCCELPPIKEINKKPNVLCPHWCKKCTIYESRPEECSNFDCLYILDEELVPDLRPDKIGVMFERITTRIYLGTYKTPKAWESPIVKSYVDELNSKGISVLFASFNDKREIKIFTTKEHTEEGVLKVARMIANNIR